jgi:amino acid adenylation domain-containing protein
MTIPSLLHEAFKAQAARTPDALAVAAGDERLTYRELADRAAQLAALLRGMGVGPEVRVGVCLERSAGLITALLGVLEAGGAYVPLDPVYPEQRLRYMLEDSRAEVLITQESCRDALPRTGPRHVLFLDGLPRDGSAAARRPARTGSGIDSGIDPGNLAYLIYTSGSTGRPKGVAIEHRSAVALVRWAREEFPPEELAGVLASTSVCFDLSVFEIFVPLSLGGAVIVAGNALDLPYLTPDPPVTLINTVPSAMAELVRSRRVPASVRVVNLAGEALPGPLVEEIYQTTQVRRVLNLYGPSEDTTYSTGAEIRHDRDMAPPIGVPLPGTRVWLLDADGAPVPPGEAGEIFLAGSGLARGYLGRPELTAERFVPDPFVEEEGERLYRTGDLARLLVSEDHRGDQREDQRGQLHYLGRVDHQVKIRGFRIELGEVESALLRHPLVREAAVAAEGEGGAKRLVAYCAGESLPEIGTMRAFLGETLPGYMIPSLFVAVEALPRTLNGKVDRKALAGLPRPAAAESGEAAGAGELVARIWSDVLGIEPVGPHDNFFHLGGHSLLGVRVLAQIHGLFGVDLPVQALFKAPTVEALAAAVTDALRGGGRPAPPPIRRAERTGPLPLSFAQERFWLLERLEAGSALYNIPLALRLKGRLEPAALAAGLREVVRRHEVLRARFAWVAGIARQEIVTSDGPELGCVDLTALPGEAREAELLRVAREEAGARFDLGSPPLLRARLLRLGSEENAFLLTAHHAVFDGWSQSLMNRELSVLYAAALEGRPSPLAEPPVQYADYAVWQRSWLTGEVMDGLLDWWRGELAGAPAVLELPADRPRPEVQRFRGAVERVAVPAALAESVAALARREGVTRFMVLLAAFQAIVHQLTGLEDFLVAAPSANRPRPEIEELMGLFVETVVLRGRLEGDPDVRELLARVRESSLAAFSHQDLPFERLVAGLRLERSSSRNPLVQVMVSLQDGLEEGFALPGLAAESLDIGAAAAKFDLSLFVEQAGGSLRIVLEYDTDLFEAVTAQRFAGRFLQVLERAVADPAARLSAIAPLSAAERRQLAAARPAGQIIAAATLVSATLPVSSSLRAEGPSRPTPTGEIVARLWAEVLGLDAVRPGDNFFHLGGHSLLGARVLAGIRDLFGVDLPLQTLFRTPTVEGLAGAIALALGDPLRGTERHGTAAAAPVPPVLRGTHERRLPLSFAQERIWFFTRLEPVSPLYNIPLALRLMGDLDPAALEAALCEIVRRHEALRTRFLEEGDRPFQEIVPDARLEMPALPLIDLSALPEEARRGELTRLVHAEAGTAFDVACAPLLRARLLRLAPSDRRHEHALLLTLHHAVFDGGSQGVLNRELSALYAAAVAGRPSPLAAPEVQYADYVTWQRSWLTAETLEGLRAWWRRELAGAPLVLEIPADRPRPEAQTFRGAVERMDLPAGLADGIAALGHSLGATRYMVLLAALQALLFRLTGEEELLVGSPSANRPRPELEGVIGLFVETLVLRGRLGGDPAFRTLVARARETALGAFAHQDLPFEDLVADLRLERNLAHNPVVQVMVSLQDGLEQGLALPGIAVEPIATAAAAARFDLSLIVEEAGGRLRAFLEYNTDLFEAVTARRFLMRSLEVVAEGVSHPAVRLSEIALLSAAERQQLLQEWNDTAAAPLPLPALHRRIAEWARRAPAAVAVVQGAQRITFAELEERAGRLARRLRRLGAGPETRVAVCLPRSITGVVALLAVWKAGGAYVPLDPAHPVDRLATVLEDAGAPLLIARGLLAGALAREGMRVLDPEDASWPGLPGEATGCSQSPKERAGQSEPGREAPDGSLAYVIYTSGSTGRPKGVEVGHPSLANLVAWHQAAYGLTPADRTTLLARVGFDASVWELWPALAAGASLHLPAEEALSAPEALRDWMVGEGITVAFAPTPLAEALLALPWPERPPLRALLTGGDALRRRPPAGLPFALINHYGPTEATVVTTAGRVAHEGGPPPAIGRPIANVRAYVMDPELRPVPAGVPGELCVAGGGLARGYLGNPAATAARYVPDPLADPMEPGARLLRTGDLVRLRLDGAIEFLGRIDRQVKLRGFRMELGEIEAALAAHPALREAAVIVAPHGAAGPRLVAFAAVRSELRDEPAPASAEVFAFLRRHLPDYMIPSAFVVLPDLPLSPNGKLDRRALAALVPVETGGSGEQPVTAVGELLAQIWCEVLGREGIGPRDSFFHLGGHSLLAARLLARIRETFDVEIPVRELFRRPTIEGLEEAITEARWGEDRALPPPIPAVPRTMLLPLSFVQEALWFLHLLEGADAVYQIPFAWRLSGPLRGDVLAASLSEVVRRHEVLRTSFVEADGRPAPRPVQEIHPPAPLLLPRLDLSGLPEGERESELDRLVRAESEAPFDLRSQDRNSPLLRAALAILGAREHALLLTVHHAVFDGLSGAILGREVSALYEAGVSGRPAELPALPVQYADFAVWQRVWLTGDTLERLVGWWRRELAGAPHVLDLPADRPRPQAQTFRGACEPLVLPDSLATEVRALGRRERATPFMILLTVFQALLHRLSGQDDLLVGTPVANRPRPEVEGLIGYFVNTVVLRGRFGRGGATFHDLLAHGRESALGAFAHQDLPFDQLVSALQVERDLSRNPLFQVMLSLDAPEEGLALTGVEARSAGIAKPSSMFDLTLSLAADGDRFSGFLEHNTDLFDRATARRLLERFTALLTAMTADPGRRLDSVPLLTAAELDELRTEAARSIGPRPRPGLLHALFTAQAARTPGATALVSAEGAALTYAELDRRSHLLARGLRRRGVGPEVPVGVCLERSPELVTALLAILAAGGVYLPLDPAYPADRLAFMLEDSGAPLVLTFGRFAAALPARGAAVLRLDEPGLAEETREETPEILPAIHPENLAYLIYTSGSTGRPKGVAIAHRWAAEHMEIAATLWGLTPADRVLLFSSPSFDVSLEEILAPLIAGSAVVIRGGALWSPADLAAKAADLRLSVLDFPTAYWQQWAADCEKVPADLPLRLVVTGGEAMSGEAARRWLRSPLAGVRLLNGYGPTEAVITSTVLEVDRAAAAAPGAVAIGQPLAGRSAWVLDGYGDPAADGAAGELCLGGPLLARGYLGRPGLTAERFVPDPFTAEPGARLYRTGDLVRRRRDGVLEFLGRVDRQVKVRGFRIELGELESALAAHPAVREAVADTRRDSAGSLALVAWIVPAEAAPGLAELRTFLRASLPEHMVPSALVVLPELPLTPNGKVDRRALPEPAVERVQGGESEAPRDHVEEIVAEIWGEILGLDRVGSHESFFHLGGHSLQATRLVALLRRTFGIDVPLTALFEGPTVAQVAERVRAALAETEQAAAVPVPVPRQGRLPLSFPQQRLWLVERLQTTRAAYNIPVTLRLTGPLGWLETAALEHSLDEVVRRHEALRTRIVERDGEMWQEIAAPAPAVLPVVDLAALPPALREGELERTGRREAARPFDLAAEPLMRAFLWRLADGEHALFVNQHHTISDGWSLDIFLRDLAAFYAAAVSGEPAALPDLPIQYADYAVWQRRWLTGSGVDAQIGYWRQRLAGVPALELPLDHPRPAVPSFRGAESSRLLDPELTEGLRRLSRSEGATPFMILLAGVQILLARSSGQEDFAVGVPVANRNRIEVEHLIGFFVNMVALRADLSRTPSFLQVLERVRDASLEAFAHQDLPFERLVEELAPERDYAVHPIFQVTFQLLVEGPPPVFPGLAAKLVSLPSGTAKFDLSWNVEESEHGLVSVCEHATDLLDRTTVARMQEQLVTLLRGAVESPEWTLPELPLLSEAQQHQLLREWNDTRADFCAAALPFELAVAQARRTPEAPAVVWSGGHLSYGALHERSERLARALRALGVGPEVRVGVCLERSPELIVSILAVHKAGGAYVALDPAHPEERLVFQLEDSQAPVLLARPGRTADLAAERGIRCLAPEEGSGAADRPAVPVLPDNLAYVIYTSGSTGQSKGVEVSHRSLLNLVLLHNRAWCVTPRDRATLVAGVGFDASVWEVWPALAAGASLHVVPEAVRTSPEGLCDWMVEQGITLSYMPVLLAEGLMTQEWPAEPALRLLLTGGDRLHRHPPASLQFPLVNAYGPTESTVICSLGPVPAAGRDERAPTLGRSIANIRLLVVDRRLRPVPIGVAGELLASGAGLARGYLRRPDLTAERFIPDPAGAEPGARAYRTGDLARLLAGGELEFLGRIDHQVKIRGYRIELGEIEAALLRHPEVREAAVLALDGSLVAYLAGPAAGSDPDGLSAFLRAALPEYMVPAAFVLLEALPLNASGKVDRGALARIKPDASAEAGYAGPRNPVEELIIALWEEILGRSPIRPGDNFFHLGGHSLLATRVLSRLRDAYGVELPVQALFAAPTVSGLAREVAAARRGTLAGVLPPLVPIDRGGLLPLSFPQQRLWFVDRLAPDSATYNMPAVYWMRGPLDPRALAAGLSAIVQRHETLRTRFVEVDGRPWQEVLPPAPLDLPFLDLSGLPAKRCSGELARLGSEEARRPFDLRRAPLLRAALLRLAQDEHALFLTLHHIVSDGWSEDILLHELSVLYTAAREGRPSPLRPLPIQYADFAVWQRAWPEEVIAEQLAYWTGKLAGLANLEVPTDRPRPPVQTFRGGIAELTVPPPLAAALRSLARERHVTHFMLLLAAWQSLFHRITGQTDVAVGSPVANRTRPEVEGLIGFFVNMLPLRAGFDGSPAFAEMLERVRQVALEAYDHADVPFERLVDELRLGRDLSRQPLVQVMFVLQGGPPQTLRLPGLEVAPLDPFDSHGAVAKFDLTLSLTDLGEAGLHGVIEHNSDLFDRTTVARFGEHLVRLLGAVVAEPGVRASEIDLLTPGERHQLLYEWNDTAAPFPAEILLHQFFEAQADRRSEALAAVWAGETLTYGALEARANRIAALLRARSVRRGTPVGVWMERSLDMLAAVLGILKAGGTYVPLDPAWPAERVESILADAATPVLLTRSAHLGPVLDLRWRLPALADVVCLDVDTLVPAPERVDTEGVRAVFDLVSERAVDRATAGGFISSFTGEPFSDAEVDEYRDRVLTLAEPWLQAGSRVLEIGSGSGLLLWEIAPRVAAYTGLDPSPLTQERNRARAAELGLTHVELPVGFAHEIESWPDGSYDLVILASTVQFFPGPLYLERIVESALRLLTPGGALLIADVPDARRQAELRRAIEEHRARSGVRQDPRKVLSLDEDLFRDLASLSEVGEVSVLHRTSGFANELSFRYDVVLSKRSESGLDLPGEATGCAAFGRPKERAGQIEPGRPGSERRKNLWTAWHIDQHAADRPSPIATPDDLAYVIHTSGSTGQPKGIVVQHRPVANLIAWINGSFGIGAADRVLFVTSLCFDLSVYDVFGLLAAGGCVHVASEEELRDAERLMQILLDEPITLWDSAPAALVRLAPLFPSTPAAASRLRRVMLSGDWIPVTLPDRVRAAFPLAQVTSLGGATEATVWSNWYPVGAVDPSWPSIPYGRPIANARYHVLDAGLFPSPVGIPGDLYIGGDCLCTGYAHQPDLTAESFLPDPFAGTPGARLYRTGDRARTFTDGNLEFLGRVDQQVKIRGFRIELGEIEVALARHPGVREAVVLAREDVPGDPRLVAYIVPRDGATGPDAAELRDLLRRGLPDYMIPSTFVELAALPVTPNGKLDRRALPAPRWDHAEGEEVVPPATPTEIALAALWREVLSVERVGRFDNFFDLGGHSLLATQLVARLRAAFGTEVALRTIFQSPVLADLAAALDAEPAAASPARGARPEIRPIPRDGELPLSASQLRQWFLVQLEPESAGYNLPIHLRFEGPLEPQVLAAALGEIVQRHEALRTTFVAAGGRPAAVISDRVELPLPLADLTALPETLRGAETRRLAAAELGRPFDLTAAPLLRVLLLRLAPGDHLLAGTFHHIVFDGFSLGVFLRELAALYAAHAAGRPSPLPPLPIQYADYAAWQRDWLESPALGAEIAHWKERLAGAAPVLHLPTDRPRPAVQTHHGNLLPLDVPPGLGAALKGLAGREAVTLFMVLLSGYATVLARYSGQDDFNIGTFVANRRWEVLERLIGFFVNTVVLRADLSGNPTFRELLGRVRDMTLDAFEHQEVPFERLLEELETERDLSRTPLFQVLFGVQNFAVPTLETGGLTVHMTGADEDDRTHTDIAYWMWEEDGDLTGWVQYSTDLFDVATMVRLFRHMATLLTAGAADPRLRLSELPLLPAEERHQILEGWSQGGAHRQPARLVHERMHEQALRAPASPAVVAGGRTLTYADLDRAAAALAAGLRHRGAGPETVIGLCIDRTPEMIVALYGILAAGAAYLPLDPTLPAERLALLLGDAGATAVLTRRGLASTLPDLPATLLCIEDLGGGAPLPGGGRAMGESTAYVLYTSGSTGTPKGVVVEHRALASFVEAALEIYAIGPGDRVLQFASLSFDTSAEEIYPCLAAGGTLVLRDEEMLASPARFMEACRAFGITVLDLPTAYWHELAGSADLLPPDVRLIILGGERALPERVRSWLAAAPSRTRLLNTYGPTEGTVVATACDLAATAPAVPIGRPLPGVEAYLLETHFEPSPPGVPGEICLGGADLARSYLGRPDLTAERFVPSSFGGPGERLYRTGDLGRWLPAGQIEFVGRADDQVKIRGFRIEPGEVAAALARHPAVREAAVVARETGAGERRLAAYAVPADPAAPPSIADLRAFLKERLPVYMIPADLVLLDALPLTRTGKVDRKALPAIEGGVVHGGHVGDGGGYAPPTTATEELLAEIWQQLLGVERAGIYDNFFDLGGHSLLVPQLIARIGDTFLVELPLRALFEAPTIAQMANVIEEILLAQIGELSDEEAASLIGEPVD